jgi:hypothetical protein
VVEIDHGVYEGDSDYCLHKSGRERMRGVVFGNLPKEH